MDFIARLVNELIQEGVKIGIQKIGEFVSKEICDANSTTKCNNSTITNNDGQKNQKDNIATENSNYEDDTITLEWEDGTTEGFLILDAVKHNCLYYAALAPRGSNEYFIYAFEEEGDNIEFFSVDDIEYEIVSKIFKARLEA
ncbi:MAG: hypothetical protein CVU50_07885 [Candidatus Cloacimonetes bacterium HGW-Cloacimonetes-3]|jgi:hypothetical protein|nr:MAG: hypothetical protein CVU50_07885 [Candidatus Cloacimonetes bacterium HGW-Cloacimonetes-3]